MAFIDFIVEPEWVYSRQAHNSSKIRLIDGTWFMPGSNDDLLKGCLEKACFFDLDVIAAPHPKLKHMLPSASQFEDFNQKAGISKNDHVICYDRHGLRTSPRLWWTYRMFGHEKVSVLNGGLPAWAEKELPILDYFSQASKNSKYQSSAPLSGVIGFNELKSILPIKPQIIDARPTGRFLGTAPEPRPGLRSGRMPGAISLPYMSLLKNKKIEDMSAVAEVIGKAGIDLNRPIITTCGSGITASGLALVFHQLGAQNVRVYDASWAEWGASDAPIEI